MAQPLLLTTDPVIKITRSTRIGREVLLNILEDPERAGEKYDQFVSKNFMPITQKKLFLLVEFSDFYRVNPTEVIFTNVSIGIRGHLFVIYLEIT